MSAHSLQLNTLTARSRSRSPAPPKPSAVTVTDADDDDDLLPTDPAMSTADSHHPEDHEPLLGAPGDQTQAESRPIAYNLISGTAILTQAGILILAATVWAAVATHAFIWPFSGHPIANSVALLLAVEAALILQPTHTATQKRRGALIHGSLNGVAFLAYLAALVMIYVNKDAHGGTHFESLHARLGLTTYVVLLLQAGVGFTMYALPQVYGGVESAKAVWKYHRMSGYALLALALVTVCAATKTDYNVNVLGMKLWVMVVASVLTLVGLVSRVKLQKLGIKREASREN